jgi:hypothetical protein
MVKAAPVSRQLHYEGLKPYLHSCTVTQLKYRPSLKHYGLVWMICILYGALCMCTSVNHTFSWVRIDRIFIIIFLPRVLVVRGICYFECMFVRKHWKDWSYLYMCKEGKGMYCTANITWQDTWLPFFFLCKPNWPVTGIVNKISSFSKHIPMHLAPTDS